GFDYRLAGSHPKTELGAPEVKVGLIPGWGGTQRLTRVIGPSLAAEMICSGDAVSAQRARETGLVFDVVPSERLLEEALRVLSWARDRGDGKEAGKRKQQRVGLTKAQHAFTSGGAGARVLEKTKAQMPAPPAALEAIAKGCNLPLADGLQIEMQTFLPLLG